MDSDHTDWREPVAPTGDWLHHARFYATGIPVRHKGRPHEALVFRRLGATLGGRTCRGPIFGIVLIEHLATPLDQVPIVDRRERPSRQLAVGTTASASFGTIECAKLCQKPCFRRETAPKRLIFVERVKGIEPSS